MKPRILPLSLSLLLIPLGPSAAQQSPDPKQANLVAYAHFKALTPDELDGLLSKAQSGDAEAQYWAGIFYIEGKVPKNSEEGARWLLKSAEQGYAPAQRIFGMMSVHADRSAGVGCAELRSKGTRMPSSGSESVTSRIGLGPSMLTSIEVVSESSRGGKP
jgi:TPR repeat protein